MSLRPIARAIATVSAVSILFVVLDLAVEHDVGAAPRTSASELDQAFQRFWAASSPSNAAKIAEQIVATGVTFEEAARRVKAGRTYTPQKTGLINLRNTTADGVTHQYLLDIPASYDPARRHQVRFQLHGGIGAKPKNQAPREADFGGLRGAEQIYAIPYAWGDAPWWSDDQLLNIRAILADIKSRYNVDENRVVLSGVSDGGTGTYYIAMRDTTPFASFLPLNGAITVLGSEHQGLNERIFPNNLRNKPFFIVNGGQDPVYPMSDVQPYVDHMKENGVAIDYHPQPSAGHDTTWWPDVKDSFENFVAEHQRDPLPDRLTWEAIAGDPHNRAHWVIIDDFESRPDDPDGPQVSLANRFGPGPGAPTPWPLFAYKPPAGRADLVRTGNTVTATTEGISGFTLLLSPDEFDFTHPIKLFVNDRLVYDDRLEPSVETLLKWAAIDQDRTMVFAAELHVR